jgi:hypothetical protein
VRIKPVSAACDSEWTFDLPARSVAVLRPLDSRAGTGR